MAVKSCSRATRYEPSRHRFLATSASAASALTGSKACRSRSPCSSWRRRTFRETSQHLGPQKGQGDALSIGDILAEAGRVEAMTRFRIVRDLEIRRKASAFDLITERPGAPSSTASGLVASLNRPGGNATGVTSLFGGLAAKQVGLLHDSVPSATLIGPPQHAQSDQ